MVYFMENPVKMGVPLWLRKPPFVISCHGQFVPTFWRLIIPSSYLLGILENPREIMGSRWFRANPWYPHLWKSPSSHYSDCTLQQPSASAPAPRNCRSAARAPVTRHLRPILMLMETTIPNTVGYLWRGARPQPVHFPCKTLVSQKSPLVISPPFLDL